VKNFVAQYCNLILYALRDPQCVCDMVASVSDWRSAVPLHSEPTGVDH